VLAALQDFTAVLCEAATHALLAHPRQQLLRHSSNQHDNCAESDIWILVCLRLGNETAINQ
jgi:hypothetical protein